MKKRSISLPLVVLIAVVALVLGSFGTATAAGLTGKQVKKIAAKVVAKKAKGLSVAHATSADTATSAATAANAASAANATNLNGLPASTYLDRVAFTSATSSLAAPSGLANSILGPLSITTPAGVNFVELEGAATMTGGNFGLYWSADGQACSSAGSEFSAAQYTVATTQGNASFHVVLPVAPGAHTYRLCSNNAAATVLARSLLIQTVPLGATGGSTITRPAPSNEVKQPAAPGVAR